MVGAFTLTILSATTSNKRKTEPTLRSESRGQTCLHYAEPQERKAHEVGLKLKTENFCPPQKKLCGGFFVGGAPAVLNGRRSEAPLWEIGVAYDRKSRLCRLDRV